MEPTTPLPDTALRDAETLRKFRGALRDARREAGLSQTELGARIGASQTQVSLWERTGKVPSMSAVARIESACELRPNTLLSILGVSISPTRLAQMVNTSTVPTMRFVRATGSGTARTSETATGAVTPGPSRQIEMYLKMLADLDEDGGIPRSPADRERFVVEWLRDAGVDVELGRSPGDGDLLLRDGDTTVEVDLPVFDTLRRASEQLAQQTHELNRVLRRTRVEEPEEKVKQITSALHTLGNRITNLEGQVQELAIRDEVTRDWLMGLIRVLSNDDEEMRLRIAEAVSRKVHPSQRIPD